MNTMQPTLLLLFTFILHIGNVFCQLPFVRLQAPTQVRYKIDKLVLACNPQNVATSDSISDIIIQKNFTTGWKDVVKVISDTSTGTLQQRVIWTDTNLQNRASVTTSIVAPTSQAGLQIDVGEENVACLDEGTYRCEINGNRGSGGGKLDSQSSPVEITMKVEPLTINPITVSPPQPENIYNPNTILTMTCYGDVGNPPEDLRWCYKRNGMDFSYTGYPESSHIVQGTASMSDCQYRRSSTLTYNVTAEIDMVEFRCETGGVSTQCGHTSSIAANFTMYRYTVVAPDSQSGPATANGGVIAGAVIGSFVGIVLIIVIIYFVAFRRKNADHTKEENGTGGAPIDNTVYSVPHKEKDRHSPRNNHYENKGLDEPHTRRHRPDMDPRGRSNPAMERSFDDVRDHNNHLSSKGPVMGSNASFGSAV